MSQQTTSNWLLLTVFKAKGYREELLAICARCGRELYAAAYEVVPQDDPSASIMVGSGCCKILTGSTPTQLAKADQQRERVRVAEEAEQEWQLTVKRWKIANAETVAFLERKAAEAEQSYNAQRKRYERNGGHYPSYNDFFDSLLDYIERRGTLTEKQMAVVERLMSRNEDAALPVRGDKMAAVGRIIRSVAKIDPYKSGYNHDAYQVELDIDYGGQHIRIIAREGTKLYQALDLKIGYDLTIQNVPKQLAVIGTVKYAKNGLVILTRAKLCEADTGSDFQRGEVI